MKFIKLFETFTEKEFKQLYKLAKEFDYNTFLKKTDSLTSMYDILYRGGQLCNQCFMTDYIGHAKSYDEENVDGIIYNHKDLLRFDDKIFNDLRNGLKSLTKKDLKAIYLPYFENHKLFDAMVDDYDTEIAVINFVSKFIKSDIPYNKIQQNKVKNDLMIPLMLFYAKTLNKNIISFWGGDYLDYGGAEEFVVNDITIYPTLKNIWSKANLK
jgi:hypothetical protein